VVGVSYFPICSGSPLENDWSPAIYRESSARLPEYRRQIAELRNKMRETRAAAEPEEVADYLFTNSAGSVRLSELFRGKSDLIVIHNMGSACPYCTLWADGLNGVYEHLASRAAFVVSSPDKPAVQKSFCRRTRLAVPDDKPSRHDLRGRYGLPRLGRQLAARGLGVSARAKPRPAGLRCRLQPARRFLLYGACSICCPEGAAGWEARFRYG
jgi:peroxiredoxin